MNNPIGVLDDHIFNPTPLKRLALMFKQIAIPWGKDRLDQLERSWPQFKHEEQRWLFERGVLIDPFAHPEPPQYDYDEEKLSAAIDEISTEFKAAEQNVRKQSKQGANFEMLMRSMVIKKKHSMQRKFALILKNCYHLDAYPVAPSLTHLDFSLGTIDVACITLKQIPTPHYLTSWEQILEFRDDPDSHHKFLDLRNWMSEVSRSSLSRIEIEQKLEYLISRYQRHMALHKMKASTGTLETILISSGEILEGLAHLKFTQVAKTLFLIKHRKISLTEAELTSPGNEVAYIIKAQETFR